MGTDGILRDPHRTFWRATDILAVVALVAYLWVLTDWWTAGLGNIRPSYRALILLGCAGTAILSGIAWTIRAIVATRIGPMPRRFLAPPVVVVIIGAFALSPLSTPDFDRSRSEFDAVTSEIRRDGPERIDYSATDRGSRRIGSEEIIRITRPLASEVHFSTTRNQYAWHFRGWVHSQDGPPKALATMYQGYETKGLGGGWCRFHGWY